MSDIITEYIKNDNSAYVRHNSICEEVVIYNSESQYILFKEEFITPPVVIISIIGKPNNDGSIYISRVDNFGFEIRSNRDRLYDIAGKLNYIASGNMIFSTENNLKYAKIDNVTGEILGFSSRKDKDFRIFTKEAYELAILNTKYIVEESVLKTNSIITEDNLVIKIQSLHSARLSAKNKIKHEISKMFEYGFETSYGRIPFTDKDKIALLESIIVDSDDIINIKFSNNIEYKILHNDIKDLYKSLLDKERFFDVIYKQMCDSIDSTDDINVLNDVTIDDVF